ACASESTTSFRHCLQVEDSELFQRQEFLPRESLLLSGNDALLAKAGYLIRRVSEHTGENFRTIGAQRRHMIAGVRRAFLELEGRVRHAHRARAIIDR